MPEETVTAPEEQTPEKKQDHRAEQTTISEFLESLLVTVILALCGTSFIVQAFKIPSASMESTLLIGDHLLVNKFIFGGTGAWYEKVLPYRQHFFVPGPGAPENKLVHQQVVTDQQRAFHRRRRNLESLYDETSAAQGQNHRHQQ